MTRGVVDARKTKSKSTRTPIELVTNPRLEVTTTSEVSSPERPDRTNQPHPGETFGSEFLDNVAHQMVAPLQAIEMNCQNIIDGIVPKTELETRLKEVVGHSKLLADFARRMRFLHELVSGKKIDAERQSFKALTKAWIDGFNNYLPTMRKLNVESDIHHVRMNKLPDVVASRLAAHQVIMNLYDNALKYGAQNSRIDVNAVRQGDFIINTFSHRAHVPLTQHAVAHMFERGFRAEEAKKVRAAGTGIGMWISRSLMRAMQGDLTAQPTDDAGLTTFRLKWKVF